MNPAEKHSWSVGDRIRKVWLETSVWARRAGFKYIIDTRVMRRAGSPLFGVAVPALIGLYLGLRELFADKWKVFYWFPNEHDRLALVLLLCLAFFPIARSIVERFVNNRQSAYAERLERITSMSAQIVLRKHRYIESSKEPFDPRDDVFLKITDPYTQLNVILTEANRFILEAFKIGSEDSLRISIMEISPTGEWEICFDTHPEWMSEFEDLEVDKITAARRALTTGEPKFYPDKRLAAVRGQYHLSSRDNRFGNGSIYCHPVRVQTDGQVTHFVVNIATYHEYKLCGDYNDAEINQTRMLLKEICRRMELELNLRAIRHWMESSQGVRDNG